MKKTLWLSVAAFCLLSGTSFAFAVLVDNFEGYTVGQIDAVTTNWRAFVGATAGLVSIATDPDNASNKVLQFTEDGASGGAYGILSGSAIIANGETKTLFYRFRTNASSGTAPNSCIGLTDVDAPGANSWTLHCVQVRLNNGTTQARNGTAWDPTPGIAISANTWYNVWVVVDHATNTWKLYMNPTAGANANPTTDRVGTVTPADAFRVSNTNALDRFTFLSYAQTPAAIILIDDISITDGTDLTYPSPVFAARNLLVNGDFEVGGGGQFVVASPYPSSWAGWGQSGSLHSDTGYRKDLKGVVFWWNDTGLFQDFAAVAGRAYMISADAITPSSGPIEVWTGRISAEWYDGTGSQIKSDTVGALTDTDPVNTWKSIKNTFFAPADTKIGRVVLMLGGSLVSDGQGGYLNSGKAYFDNVAVKGLEPDYNNDNMVKLDDFAAASATWLGTSEITDLNGDSFFGWEDLVCFARSWLQPIPDYELVWSDEFEGSELNLNNWEREILSGWATGNNELEYYTDHTTNSWVAGGMLTIEAREESYLGYDYTSARLRTKGKHDFTYGKMEARIKIPSTKGIWPAFWMLPTDKEYGGWPRSGEIDIMESINQAVKIYGTIHYGGAGTEHRSSGGSYTGVSDFSTDFHVYAIEWEPTRIRWYVDGNLYSTKTSWDSTGGPYPAPFDKRFYLLLNVAVGGNWPGPPDGTSVFPQQMVVDYVRVYKKAK